jgi:hypothetical protein
MNNSGMEKFCECGSVEVFRKLSEDGESWRIEFRLYGKPLTAETETFPLYSDSELRAHVCQTAADPAAHPPTDSR